ncbi:transcription cofactor vestigial-like protein 3 [Diretmus argenteus]
MSCLDVRYHQSYGAHYLPAAAAYNAAYYHQHQRHQRHQRHQHQHHHSSPKDGSQPAETEYLSSRCVLFTYFQGDIGDVVDEHFSRALNRPSTFTCETKPIRVTQPSASATAGVWKDGVSLSEGQGSTLWNSAYPSQASPCLPSISVSIHPDFSPSPVSFHPPDGALWAGHAPSQVGLPPLTALPETWTYSLNPQGAGSYAHIHDVYHPHTQAHVHARHPHPMLHTYPAHSPTLDPRFTTLLLPGVRNQNQSVPSPGSHVSPHSEGVKTEMSPSSNSPLSATSSTWTPSALHGPLEMYDSCRRLIQSGRHSLQKETDANRGTDSKESINVTYSLPVFPERMHVHCVTRAKKAFASLGPKCVNWKEKIVAMGAEGAAVNLAHKGGVIALLQAEIGSFVVPFHCMPHRLELGMLSVQRDVSMIGHVYDLLHLIWKTYHFSPKSMRELKALRGEIGVTVNAPSGVKGTRWLPHVSRSLSTFLKPGKDGNPQSSGQFTAVYLHMDHLAGASANAEIAGRAKK